MDEIEPTGEQETRRTAYRTWRKAWVFPSEIENQLGKWVSREPHPILHLFAGRSNLGDFHVDLTFDAHRHVADAIDIRADAYRLPFHDKTFATVIADPDWNDDWKKRWRLAKEIARVMRPDGRLYLNAPWVPTSGMDWVVEAVWVVHLRWGMPRNASLLTICRRRDAEPA